MPIPNPNKSKIYNIIANYLTQERISLLECVTPKSILQDDVIFEDDDDITAFQLGQAYEQALCVMMKEPPPTPQEIMITVPESEESNIESQIQDFLVERIGNNATSKEYSNEILDITYDTNKLVTDPMMQNFIDIFKEVSGNELTQDDEDCLVSTISTAFKYGQLIERIETNKRMEEILAA